MTDTQPFSVRIPKKTLKSLRDYSRKNARSISGSIVFLLENSLQIEHAQAEGQPSDLLTAAPASRTSPKRP